MFAFILGDRLGGEINLFKREGKTQSNSTIISDNHSSPPAVPMKGLEEQPAFGPGWLAPPFLIILGIS